MVGDVYDFQMMLNWISEFWKERTNKLPWDADFRVELACATSILADAFQSVVQAHRDEFKMDDKQAVRNFF